LDPATDTTFSQLGYVREALQDAESLLQFASETGVAIDDQTKNSVLTARARFATGLDQSTVANLLTALARLAAILAPVSPQSLRECKGKDIPRSHPYRTWASVLAFIIVVYSTLSFVTSAIDDAMLANINTANALAVKLNAEFPATTGPSSTELPAGLSRPDVTKDLQQFAATIRNIDSQSRELSLYTHPFKSMVDPASLDPYHAIRGNPELLSKTFELHLPLTDYGQATLDCTATYQKVRYFAQHLADDASFYYGAVSSCILPVFYALLGTFAYILRRFEQRVSNRSYVPSPADSARFVIAAIGGAVVGLFTNFTAGQGVKVSPLAVAFLVGYAVDVFYAFLEALIQSFTKTALASDPSARTTSPAPDAAKTAPS
jgi:hypothetical protein